MKKVLLTLCFLMGVWSANATVPSRLDTSENRDILKKVESTLSKIKTMKSRFSEFSSKDGDFMKHGNFYMSRPNKMRLIYDEPTPLEFIADGQNFIYYDKSFDQISLLDINQTPAAILLKPDFTFDDPAFEVTDIKQELDEYHISAIKTGQAELGTLTVIVTQDPLEFNQWELVDMKGIKSTVGLYETVLNEPVDESLFIFKKD